MKTLVVLRGLKVVKVIHHRINDFLNDEFAIFKNKDLTEIMSYF